MTSFRIIAFALLLPTCLAAQWPEVVQDSFDGTALLPLWQPFPNAGAITVSGGLLHLSINPSGTEQAFPYLRTLPGLGTVPSPKWILEARMAWSFAGGPTVNHFGATTSPLNPGACAPKDIDLPGPSGPVHVKVDGLTRAMRVQAGDTMLDVGTVDSALHGYRWVSDGITVTFSLDSIPFFAGNYDGNQPNNLWIGNPCAATSLNWSNITVDRIRFEWGQILAGPAIASIGTPIYYELALAPFTPYYFDVSVTGTYPGVVYGPANLLIPLNPPFLGYDLGAALPDVFLNFLGISNSSGLAVTAVDLPRAPSLVGISISAAYVVLDPSAPGGIRAVAQPITTTIVP